jgi:hypothetical protein
MGSRMESDSISSSLATSFASQPSTDVDLRRVIGDAVDLDRLGERDEAERPDDRPVCLDVSEREVEPPQLGPELHVDALDVEPAGGLNLGGKLSPLVAQPAAVEEDALPVRHEFTPQVLAPEPGNGIGVDHAVGYAIGLAQHREADDSTALVTYNPKGVRRMLPP